MYKRDYCFSLWQMRGKKLCCAKLFKMNEMGRNHKGAQKASL
jgi:hypothetical protein